MKQKRKVTNLLSSTFAKEVKVFVLLFFWCVLCWWAISLLSMTEVWAASTSQIKSVPYTWINDDVEVLYQISFLNGNKVVNNMFISGDSLYITPTPVMVRSSVQGNFETNSNRVVDNVYWNILWWYQNRLGWKNVTLVGWRYNDIGEWAENATVLWWSGNRIYGNNDYPILLWGSGNYIDSTDGLVSIIWWSSNTGSVPNVTMLWWVNNNVTAWNDVIVWWKNVSVWSSISNIFVFSDGSEDGWSDTFEPRWSDSFYLKVRKWLWLNVSNTSLKWWVESSWAVSLWEVDIYSEISSCEGDNIWVIWAWSGCLVWCTYESSLSGQWEMLDMGEVCQSKCLNSEKCKITVKPEPEDYIGACILDSIRSNLDIPNPKGSIYPRIVSCEGNNYTNYKNVFFEAFLQQNCPSPLWDNKCAYRCNDNSTLIDGICRRNCQLPGGGSVSHGTTGLELTNGWYDGIYSCVDGSLVFNRCVEGKHETSPRSEICEPDVREEQCVERWKPDEGSEYIHVNVTVHWVPDSVDEGWRWGHWPSETEKQNGEYLWASCWWECSPTCEGDECQKGENTYHLSEDKNSCDRDWVEKQCREWYKPDNSKYVYTWSIKWWSDEPDYCEFECNANYDKKEVGWYIICEPRTQTWACNVVSGSNWSWVNSGFTQTWDGSQNKFVPMMPVENVCVDDWHGEECAFECGANYKCNGEKWDKAWCIQEVEPSCDNLPTDKWVVVNENGLKPTVSTGYTYSTNTGDVCTYRCAYNYLPKYDWDNVIGCEPETQKVNCTDAWKSPSGKPDRAIWTNFEFTQEWNGSSWVPATHKLEYSSDTAVECSIVCEENTIPEQQGNGYVCNEIDGGDTRRELCPTVPENWRYLLDGKYLQTRNPGESEWNPSYAEPEYTWNFDVPCAFLCKNHYEWDGYNCIPEHEIWYCAGKPDNSDWVRTPSTYIRTFSGTEFVPVSVDAVYDPSGESDCAFDCKKNYKYENGECVPKTNVKDCGDLPANAAGWLNSQFTQIWSGNKFTPTTWIDLYNCGEWASSDRACSFYCKSEYKCNGMVWSAAWCTKDPVCKNEPNPFDWVVRNEGTDSPEIDTDWTYNPGSKKACTYHCDTGYGPKYDANNNVIGCEQLQNSEWKCIDLPADEGVRENLNVKPENDKVFEYSEDESKVCTYHCDTSAGYEPKYDSNNKVIGCKKGSVACINEPDPFDWVVQNENTNPPKKDTNWTYNPGSTDACTYHCDTSAWYGPKKDANWNVIGCVRKCEVTYNATQNGWNASIGKKSFDIWTTLYFVDDDGKQLYSASKSFWFHVWWNTNSSATAWMKSYVLADNGNGSCDVTFYAIFNQERSMIFWKNGAELIGWKSDEKVTEKCFAFNGGNCIVNALSIDRKNSVINWWNTYEDWDPQGDVKNVWDEIVLKKNNISNPSYFAQTEKEVTAKFDENKGNQNCALWLSSISPDVDQKCTIKNKATECGDFETPTINTKAGYKAEWWLNYAGEKKKDGDVMTQIPNISENTTFYALVRPGSCTDTTYTITYDVNWWDSVTRKYDTGIADGTEVSIKKDDNVAIKQGWNHIWWNTDKNATVWLEKYKISCSNVTLYAIFEKDCKVTFNKNGASSIGSSSFTCKIYNNDSSCKEQQVEFPSITAKNGFTVVWWNATQNPASQTTNNKNVGDKENVTASMCGKTYYAQTYKDLKATFKKNDTCPDSTHVNTIYVNGVVWSEAVCRIINDKPSCSVQSATMKVDDNYSAVWWTSDKTKCNVADYGTDKEISLEDDMTFYAVVKSDNLCLTDTYKLAFDYQTNWWTSMRKKDKTGLKHGEVVNLKDPDYEPSGEGGWKFVCWAESKDGPCIDSITMDCEDRKVYAQFDKDCTITFEWNGASVWDSSTSLWSGAIDLTCTMRNKGWSCDVSAPLIKGEEWFQTRWWSGGIYWYVDGKKNQVSVNSSVSCSDSSLHTYYAQTYNPWYTCEVGFKLNGAEKLIDVNGVVYTEDMTWFCITDASYNWKALKDCSITSLNISWTNNTPEVIWWGTDTSSHSSAWDVLTSKTKKNGICSNKTGNNTYFGSYYAQTKKSSETYTITFHKNKADYMKVNGAVYSGEEKSISCETNTYYNWNWWGTQWCTIKSPDIVWTGNTPSVLWWSTAPDLHTNEWSRNTSKRVKQSDDYYAQTYKDWYNSPVTFHINGAFALSVWTQNSTESMDVDCVVDTVWNGSGQDTTNTIESPGITAKQGFEVRWWSVAENDHVSIWTPWTSKKVTCGNDYYAQTMKKGWKCYVNFDINGAKKIDWKTESFNKYCTIPAAYNWNDSNQIAGCSITSPTIEGSDDTPEVLWWSRDANSHKGDWTVNTSKNVATECDSTYYAQTYRKSQTNYVIFHNSSYSKYFSISGVNYTTTRKPWGCTIPAIYNWEERKPECSKDYISPTFVVDDPNSVKWWSTNTGYYLDGWDVNTTKRVLFRGEDIDYYTYSVVHWQCDYTGTDSFNCAKGTPINKVAWETEDTWTCRWERGWDNEDCVKAGGEAGRRPVNWECKTTHFGCEQWYSREHKTDSSNNKWTWKCVWINNWQTADCSEDGPKCNTSHYNCIKWTPTNKNSSAGSYTWDCEEWDGGGKLTVHCSEEITVNWSCGSTPYNCVAWTSQNWAFANNQWTWQCVWLNGGDPAYCFDNGPQCGGSHYSCVAWNSVNNNNGLSEKWTWQCKKWSDTVGRKTVDCEEAKPESCWECGTKHYECKKWESQNGKYVESSNQWTWQCKWSLCSSVQQCDEPWPKCKTTHYGCEEWWTSIDNFLDEQTHKYRWKCEKDGVKVNCEQNQKVNWSCWNSKDTCASWKFKDVSDTSTHYKWDCLWLNGWNDANCSECFNCDTCFPAWTKIVMSDGTQKNIEDIEIWDKVLSYNTDSNSNEISTVEQTIVHEDSEHEMYELTINGKILKVTGVHPFYVRKSGIVDTSRFEMSNIRLKGMNMWVITSLALPLEYDWVEAQNLEVWDKLLMIDGSLVEIEKINHYHNQETVYNLEVEGNHDYFVDQWYLVHNKSCFLAWTKVIMADGTLKNIEDVKIWEKLLWSDWSINTVLSYDRHLLWERRVWSINGSEYFVSDEHPFMTTEWWKSFVPEKTKEELWWDIPALKVWDVLVTSNGLEVLETFSSKQIDRDTPIYNFALDGDHTYHANNYLVHNKWCFPAWTKVFMADGSQKNIEDVKEWDVVLSYNVDKDINERSVVKQTIVHDELIHEMYELTINGKVLKVTDVHPFYVRQSGLSKVYDWVEAQNLKVWDKLLMIDGSLVEIENIRHYYNQETVYNLEVEGNHDYFVDRWYLVHNKWWWWDDGYVTPNCFVAWTKVTMVDGSKKNIEDIEIWEKVLWSNWSINTVLWFHKPLLEGKQLWSINGWKYFVTSEHPFMTTEWWKSLNPELSMNGMNTKVWLLKVWDELITESWNIKVSSLASRYWTPDTQLYNLMLDWDHTYYANGYLVHNKNNNGNNDNGNNDTYGKTIHCFGNRTWPNEIDTVSGTGCSASGALAAFISWWNLLTGGEFTGSELMYNCEDVCETAICTCSPSYDGNSCVVDGSDGDCCSCREERY